MRNLSLVIVLACGTSYLSAQQKDPKLALTQLKAAEAFYRLNQLDEAKKILSQTNPADRGWEWRLLNARSDRSIHTFRDHTKQVIGIAVSKDGRHFASGSADNTIIIWDASNYQPVKKMEGHKGQVTTIDFSPDGRWLVSGSTDKTLRLWSVQEGREEKNFNSEFSQGIYQAKFSPDGKKIGAVSWEFTKGNVQGFVKIFDAAAGGVLNRIDTDEKPASAIDFSPDGKKIITGTWNFVVKEHDLSLNNSTLLYDLKKFDYYTAVQSIDYSPDGKLIAESGKDNRIRLLQADGKLLYQVDPWNGHTQWVNCVRFSPDGKYLASASDDGLLKVWDAATMNNIYTFRGHEGGLFQLAWHPDGQRIFTSSADGTIKLWDLQKTGDKTFDIAESGPWYAPVTGDGKYMVCAGSDKALGVWDLDKAARIAVLDTFSNNAAVISDDGRFIAAGGHARMVSGFDMSSRKKMFSSSGIPQAYSA